MRKFINTPPNTRPRVRKMRKTLKEYGIATDSIFFQVSMLFAEFQGSLETHEDHPLAVEEDIAMGRLG